MSSIRTQIAHKSIMLGILFLGILLNSQYEEWISKDAVADQAKTPETEVQATPSQDEDLLDAQEDTVVSMASLG